MAPAFSTGSVLAAVAAVALAMAPLASAQAPFFTLAMCRRTSNSQTDCGAWDVDTPNNPYFRLDVNSPVATYFSGNFKILGQRIAPGTEDVYTMVVDTDNDGDNVQLRKSSLRQDGFTTLTTIAKSDLGWNINMGLQFGLDAANTKTFSYVGYSASSYGIQEIDWTAGTTSILPSSGGSAFLNEPASGICVDAANSKVYFGYQNDRIISANTDGTGVAVFNLNAASTTPLQSCFFYNDKLYASVHSGSNQDAKIVWYDVAGADSDAPTEISTTVAGHPNLGVQMSHADGTSYMAVAGTNGVYVGDITSTTWNSLGSSDNIITGGSNSDKWPWSIALKAYPCTVGFGTCGADEYMDMCNSSYSGGCKPCGAACGNGQYTIQQCGNTVAVPRICGQCNPLCDWSGTCNSADATSCNAGCNGTVAWSDGGVCVAHTQCTSDQFEPSDGAPDATKDRKCCSNLCDPSQSCSGTGANQCDACHPTMAYDNGGVCTALTECTAEQFQPADGAPTTNTDRKCCSNACDNTQSCSGPGAGDCDACAGSDTWTDGTNCYVWTTCASNQREIIAPTSSRDRVCEDCDPACKTCTNSGNAGCAPVSDGNGGTRADCADGYFTSQASLFLECNAWRGACTSADGDPYYEIQPTVTSDRVCGQCSSACDASYPCVSGGANGCELGPTGTWLYCAAGYTTKPFGPSISCQACEACPSGEYRSACDTESGKTCMALTVCASDEFVSVNETETTDRTCTSCNAACATCHDNTDMCSHVGGMPDCASGYYADQSTNGRCVAHTPDNCGSNTYYVSGTKTADSSCESCNSACWACSGPTSMDCTQTNAGGPYCNSGYQAAAAGFPANCVQCSDCPAGKYRQTWCDLAFGGGGTVCADCHVACGSCSGSQRSQCETVTPMGGGMPHANCSMGYYATDATTCMPHNSCNDGNFWVIPPNMTYPGLCDQCHDACNTCHGPMPSDCNPTSGPGTTLDCEQYPSGNNDARYYDNGAGVCVLTEYSCPSGEYRTAQASATSAVACAQCGTCGADETMMSPCEGDNDIVCSGNGLSPDPVYDDDDVTLVDVTVTVEMCLPLLNAGDITASDVEAAMRQVLAQYLSSDAVISAELSPGCGDGNGASGGGSNSNTNSSRRLQATGLQVVITITQQAAAAVARGQANDFEDAVAVDTFSGEFARALQAQGSGLTVEQTTPKAGSITATGETNGARSLVASLAMLFVCALAGSYMMALDM